MKRINGIILSRRFAALWLIVTALHFFVWPSATAFAILVISFLTLLCHVQPIQKWAARLTLPMSLLLVLMIFTPRPAKALFGEDIPVLLSILAQAQLQVQQLIQQFDLAKQNIQRLTQRSFWMTYTHPSLQDVTRNTYGETSRWGSMLNGSPNLAASSWAAATVGVQPNVALQNEQLGNSAALARLASVEAVDGSATKCLATIAQYRADAAANLRAQTSLQSAQLDSSDATNSEIEQLNLLNAAQAQAANEQRSQNMMQTCLIEQQVLANKMERDSLAGHMNFFTEVQRYDTTEGNAWIGAGSFLNSH